MKTLLISVLCFITLDVHTLFVNTFGLLLVCLYVNVKGGETPPDLLRPDWYY